MNTASSTPMRPWAVVEIADGSDEGTRTELIRAAYRSSRSGVVALALRGVTRQVADLALDPVVDCRNDLLRGVIYMDATETKEDLFSAAARASVVIACTDDFRRELHDRGIPVLELGDATRALLESSDLDVEDLPHRSISQARV